MNRIVIFGLAFSAWLLFLLAGYGLVFLGYDLVLLVSK